MAPAPQSGEGWTQHRRQERDGLALAPPNGGVMETSRYRRAERDGIAPTPQSGDGWPQHRRVERDGLALAPPNGGGMETSRYRRAERDGIAPTPQSGDGWHRRVERDGPSTADRRGMVSP